MEKDLKEKLAKGWILARAMIEIAGKPKDHIEKTLDIIEESLRKQKDIQLLKAEKFPPEEHDGIFSAFIEAEMIFKNIEVIRIFCFEYLPSSLEIIEPKEFILKNDEASNFFNDLLARLHSYDMQLKNKNAENILLNRNIANLLRNIIFLSLKSGEKDIKQIVADTGIKEEHLKELLELLIKEGKIKKKKELYSEA